MDIYRYQEKSQKFKSQIPDSKDKKQKKMIKKILVDIKMILIETDRNKNDINGY